MMHGMKHTVVKIMNLAVVMLSAQGWTWSVTKDPPYISYINLGGVTGANMHTQLFVINNLFYYVDYRV
jgi:hypothetical protein